MCWAGRCCFCLRLGIGGNLIGFFSFILSTFFFVGSSALLGLDINEDPHGSGYRVVLDLNQSSFDIILVMLLLMSALGVVSSCMLVYGLWRNKAGFVLCYFGHGIMVVILTLLSALLELLKPHQYWPLALGQILAALVFIHWLVVIHTMYQLMLQGKRFGVNGHELLEDEEPWLVALSEDELAVASSNTNPIDPPSV